MPIQNSYENLPFFPTGSLNNYIQRPLNNEIEIADILVARYKSSRWSRYLPWEQWHHAALVSNVAPLKIIEAVGPNSVLQLDGPDEVLFEDSVAFGRAKDLLELIWLKPIFPNPIRTVANWTIPRSHREIISEKKARQRVIAFAHKQIGERYFLGASKCGENSWYCSSLVYKSFSRTITDMYLETYNLVRGGYYVTPEDLLKSKKTKEYFSCKPSGNILIV